MLCYSISLKFKNSSSESTMTEVRIVVTTAQGKVAVSVKMAMRELSGPDWWLNECGYTKNLSSHVLKICSH